MAFLQYFQVSDLDLEERKGNLYCSLFNKAVASSPLYASGSLSPSAKAGDISIEIEAEMRVVGGPDLPRQGKCLERRDVIQMLESHPRMPDRFVTDSRCYGGISTYTDHKLVKIMITFTWWRKKYIQPVTSKLDIEKLEDKSKRYKR